MLAEDECLIKRNKYFLRKSENIPRYLLKFSLIILHHQFLSGKIVSLRAGKDFILQFFFFKNLIVLAKVLSVRFTLCEGVSIFLKKLEDIAFVILHNHFLN